MGLKENLLVVITLEHSSDDWRQVQTSMPLKKDYRVAWKSHRSDMDSLSKVRVSQWRTSDQQVSGLWLFQHQQRWLCQVSDDALPSCFCVGTSLQKQFTEQWLQSRFLPEYFSKWCGQIMTYLWDHLWWYRSSFHLRRRYILCRDLDDQYLGQGQSLSLSLPCSLRTAQPFDRFSHLWNLPWLYPSPAWFRKIHFVLWVSLGSTHTTRPASKNLGLP